VGVPPALLNYVVSEFAIGRGITDLVVAIRIPAFCLGDGAVGDGAHLDAVAFFEQARGFGALLCGKAVGKVVVMSAPDVVACGQSSANTCCDGPPYGETDEEVEDDQHADNPLFFREGYHGRNHSHLDLSNGLTYATEKWFSGLFAVAFGQI